MTLTRKERLKAQRRIEIKERERERAVAAAVTERLMPDVYEIAERLVKSYRVSYPFPAELYHAYGPHHG